MLIKKSLTALFITLTLASSPLFSHEAVDAASSVPSCVCGCGCVADCSCDCTKAAPCDCGPEMKATEAS